MCKIVSFFLLALTAAAIVAGEDLPNAVTAQEAKEGFILLFDGKTLDGWDGDPRMWSVRNGAIVGSSDKHSPEHNTSLIYKQPYSDFVLKAEVGKSGASHGH